MTFRRDDGREGEARAREYLEKKGYAFLTANHRTRTGEVDLIMKRGPTVVFVEVKSRRGGAFGSPQEAVTPAKQRKVILAALEFIKSEGLAGAPFRFDVVSIGPAGLEHVENAFDAAAGAYTL